MTDKELEAMRARQYDPVRLPPGITDGAIESIQAAFEDRINLLAEVEQLRAIVKIVAQGVGAGSSIEFDQFGDIFGEDVVRKARAAIDIGPLADAESD